jgi:hypothetical protein
MIYFPGTINRVSIQLYCHTYITMNLFFILSYARRHSLCACWHLETVKGSSSSSSLCLLISLWWVTSSLPLCLELTDALCHCCGASPPLSQYGALIHRVRTHPVLRVQENYSLAVRTPTKDEMVMGLNPDVIRGKMVYLSYRCFFKALFLLSTIKIFSSHVKT